MYHLMGIREQECTCAEYSGSVAVLYVKTKKNEFYCAKCGSRHVIRSGVVEREFRSVPVGSKPVVVRMKVQRLECKECGSVSQEHIHFAKPGRSYTRRMATFVVDLSRAMTLKAVSAFTGLSWNTVKEIVETYLERHYSRPDLSEVTVIGIDEFAVKKGHVYKTIVVDLLSGRILHVGDGKGAEALDGFWKRLGDSKAKIKAVAMDMSGAFISAVRDDAKMGKRRVRNAKIEGMKANAVCFGCISKWLIMSVMRNNCEKYFVRIKNVRIFASESPSDEILPRPSQPLKLAIFFEEYEQTESYRIC